MPVKTPDAGSKPSRHSCRSDARRLCKSGKPSGVVGVSDSGGGDIKDMPVDVLERIFGAYSPFKSLEQVGQFGGNFPKACENLMRAAYLQLENDLLHDITDCKEKFAASLLAEDTDKDASTAKKRTLCKSIFQLETLSSTFAHVKATIWSYTSAGVCTRFDGELLDYFHRARASIATAIGRDPATKAASDRLIGRCRDLAATFIWTFLLEVEEKTLPEDERRGVDILGAVSLLHTLVCAKDSHTSPIALTRYKDAPLVRVAVDFTLPRCWMGYFASKDYAKQPSEERAVDAMHVIRQLVWVGNGEFHLHACQEAMKRIDLPQPKVPKSASLLLGQGTYGNDGGTGRWFASVEADDERVFYFGLRSRARFRKCSRPRNPSPEERIRLVDRVVTVPKGYKDAVLDVQLSITCDEKLLPEGLLCGVVDERASPQGLMPGFALQIVCYEDAGRATRVCAFPCFETGRRPGDKRLLIGEHGLRLMQVGDSVDKHRIYEAQGKNALGASPSFH